MSEKWDHYVKIVNKYVSVLKMIFEWFYRLAGDLIYNYLRYYKNYWLVNSILPAY